MDSDKCRALVYAIETGSMTEAAARMGYTISGISRMLNALEEEMGCSLLIRSKSGVVPTGECEILLPAIHAFLQEEEKIFQLAGEIQGVSRGKLIIGTAYYKYYGWLMEILAEFKTNYPNIEIEIIEGTSSEMIQAVEERRADLCIVSKRTGNYRWIPLKQDALIALLPKDHPMAKRKSFPVTAFEEEDFIELYPGLKTDNSLMFEQNKIVPNTKYSTSDNYAAYEMVRSGFGVTCTNKLFMESFSDRVTALPLDPPYIVDIGIAAVDEGVASPAAKHLLEFLKNQNKKM